MTWRRIKRDRADHWFSLYIRTRDGWTCQYCYKSFPVGAGNLHNSHFFTRETENTRFDEENCDAMCSYHHEYLGKHHETYRNWKIKQLGEKRFELLVLRSNLRCKKDRKLMAFVWRQEYKKLKENDGRGLSKSTTSRAACI